MDIDLIYFDVEDLDIEAFYRLIGKNVKDIRTQKGLSQLDLANMIGHSSVGLIAKAELYKYKRKFNLEQLYKISKALDVDFVRFFEGIEDLAPDQD